jgi:myosin heavy subunit
VVAAVTISRSAFPNRLTHKGCIDRFKVLSKEKKVEGAPELEPKDEIVKLLTPPMVNFKGENDGKPSFVVGISRVYFKMGALEFLEAERMRSWDTWAVDIQKVARGWLSRRVAQKVRQQAEAAAEAILQAERDRIYEEEREEREKKEAEEAAAEAILQAERDRIFEEEREEREKKEAEEAAAEAILQAERDAEEARKAEEEKEERAAAAAAAAAEEARLAEEEKEARAAAAAEKVRAAEAIKVAAAREIEEAAAADAAEKEARGLEGEREIVRKVYYDQMEELKEKMKEVDDDKKVRIQEAKDSKAQLEKEIEELKELTSADNKKALMEPKKIAARQKKILEESKATIETLKKENKTIRKAHDKASDKFAVVKENNDRLLQVNEDVGGDFENVDSSASKVNDKNESLLAALEKATTDNKQLKKDCMTRQEDYMTQAETRLEYQKTMARILNMIGDTCKEQKVVEDTHTIALECEATSKTIMADLEAETEDSDEDSDDE